VNAVVSCSLLLTHISCRHSQYMYDVSAIDEVALAAPDEPPPVFRDPLGNRACVRKRRAIRTRGVFTALDARFETCNGLSLVGLLLAAVVVMRVDGLVGSSLGIWRPAQLRPLVLGSWIEDRDKVTCCPGSTCTMTRHIVGQNTLRRSSTIVEQYRYVPGPKRLTPCQNLSKGPSACQLGSARGY
jgi:hypothetical protein